MNHDELAKLGRSKDPEDRKKFKDALPYMHDYDNIDFKKHPEKYKINRGEQGVLMAEPYKSDIVKHWRFKTPEIATESAKKIYKMFLEYLEKEDFVGADMARKFLMMGWTRARRYANHPSGRKYKKGTREILPFADDHQTSDKAESAKIFKEVYDKARQNATYLKLKEAHKAMLKLQK
jgi:hypothetical protein